MDLQAVHDKLEIHELLARYARGVDSKDWGNIEVELDGDTAKVRAMFYNPMQLPGMAEQSACGGYYHHDLIRTHDGWKSARLVEENVWFVNPPGEGAG